METNLFTISLYCRHARANANNEAPLYLTINQGEQRKLISLNAKLNIRYWDSQSKTISQDCPDKGYYELLIDNKKQEINKKIITANLEGRELLLDDFSDKKPKEEKQFVKQHFEKYIQELYAEDRIKNAKYYLCCLNCLLDFTHGRNPEFKQVDVPFLTDYTYWMQVTKKLKKNTVGNRLRGLKAIFNRAIASKAINTEVYPFNEFKVGKYREETSKRAIPKQDIERIINLDLHTISDKQSFPFYDFARDMFVFSYLGCGINIVDIAYLTYNNVIDQERLQFRRRKTKKLISFKLQPLALEILKKYSKPDRQLNDYIFPILTYGKHETAKDRYNRVTFRTKMIDIYLKKIGEYLGIPLKLTSYVARHSFATVLKRSGVNTSIICEAMGHSSEKVTQIYLDSFENEQVDAAMSNLL